MPAKQQEKPASAREAEDGRQRNLAIGKNVLGLLGLPADLWRVEVRPLWEDRYRVNVFVGKDITAATIAHSYFLVAQGDGHILDSTPTITRHY